MNYRHAFHAGNFADVVKHFVLTQVLLHLQDKPAAFRVIDSHAGAGRYDLTGIEARRSGEWRRGIARLLASDAERRLPAEAAALLRPYLDIVRAFNVEASAATGENGGGSDNGSVSDRVMATAGWTAAATPGAAATDPSADAPADPAAYPGSPLIARALLRPQDRMTLCETEPTARRQLIAALRRDAQARVVDLDGWTALPAFVPPNERRGVVLVDPPFEQPGEFERLARGFAAAYAKWPTGCFILWYPLKDARAAGDMERAVARTVAAASPGGGACEKCLRLTFFVDIQRRDGPLAGAGLLIVNPPWTLRRDLAIVLPALAAVLGEGDAGRFTLDHPAA